MAGGWRKAWLSVLGRGGGGGSTGSLQAHLQGHHLSPSSSSSSLASYRPRGGKHGGGGGKAVVGSFAAALAFAFFFYVSVVPSSSPASSPAVLLSWLTTSSSSSTAPAAGKSLPPRPPIPPAVTASSAADQLRSGAAMASRRVQSSEEGDPSAVEGGSGQSADPLGSSLQDAGNITVISDAEPVGNGDREEKPQVETAMAMPVAPLWRRTDGANSSRAAIVAAPGEPEGGAALTTGDNSTDAKAPSRQVEVTKNAAVDNAHNATRQAADLLPPSPPQRKEDRHRRKRAARRRHVRRRKDTVLPAAAAQEAAAASSDGVNTSAAVVSRNKMPGANASVAAVVGPGGDNRVVWTSGVQDLVSFAKCDVFNGRWVRDESYRFYPPKSCPHIDDDFNCHKNGRPDSDFLKWRWQPHGCDIPRLNATEFLERLRGQRIIFVGDSLNRNMWESLVCTLRHGVREKSNVYEASGRNQFKTRGYYSFKFREYNCSVDFIRSTFLVNEVIREGGNGTEDKRLKLDELDAATPAYQTANIVVFNTGHWWTHAKTSEGLNYYQEGNHVYPRLDVMDAYKKALTTWARWVDKYVDPRRTQVVFRGYSLQHFRGGLWDSGGRCHRETEPIFNQTHLTKYPKKMIVLEQVLRQMKTPVIYLNISRLTDYRKDGHPSVYRIRYDTEEERMAAVTKQDCSHWCLPGVPDTWNELLYASLLQAGQGSWKL